MCSKYGDLSDRLGAMNLNNMRRSPLANAKSASERASEDNLPQEFDRLSLNGRRPYGGSNRNSKRLNSRKKLRKNRRVNKTRRYRK